MTEVINDQVRENKFDGSFLEKFIKSCNFYLFMILWIFFVPCLHFVSSINDDLILTFINYIDYIFIACFCFWGLLFLCKNLTIYKATFVNIALLAVLAIMIAGLFHLSTISFMPNELFPYTSLLFLLFSLHQITYSQVERLHFLFIIVIGTSLSTCFVLFAQIFNIEIHISPFDQILPYIGIVIAFYLLTTKLTIYYIIGIILSSIILFIAALQYITIETVVVAFVPIIGLWIFILKSNKTEGISLLVIMTSCLIIAYFLNFFAQIDFSNDYQLLKTELTASLTTLQDHFILGTGYSTFSLANLSSNPNFYLEHSSSFFLKLAIECGLLGTIAWIIIIYATFYLIFNNPLPINTKIINFLLVWPFVIMYYQSSFMHNNALSHIMLAFILWQIGCCNKVKSTPTTVIYLSRRGLSKVSLVIFFTLLQVFLISGTISIKQMSSLEKQGNCENISEKILNPFSVGLHKTQLEFKCLYHTGMNLPSTQLLNAYLNHGIPEAVYFNPKIEYFQNLKEAYHLYKDEEKEKVKELIATYYPMIEIPQDDQNKDQDEISSSKEDQVDDLSITKETNDLNKTN